MDDNHPVPLRLALLPQSIDVAGRCSGLLNVVALSAHSVGLHQIRARFPFKLAECSRLEVGHDAIAADQRPKSTAPTAYAALQDIGHLLCPPLLHAIIPRPWTQA